MAHAVRRPDERSAHELLLARLADRGAACSWIVWDRGMVDLDLRAWGPSREIEAINRWRLPQWLAKAGLAPLGRALRNGRVRWWWRRAGAPDAVVLLGPVRPEMAHYLPPGDAPVSAVLGWRPDEPEESRDLTLALADTVVATDEATAASLRTADPTTRVVTYDDLATPAPDGGPAAEPLVVGVAPDGGPAAEPLVVGVGPGDWRGAPDLFLRAAAPVRDQCGRPVRFAWLGVDPADGRSFPYRFDAEHLGLAGLLTWSVLPAEGVEALRNATVVVLVPRTEFPLPVHPVLQQVGSTRLLQALGTPVLGFDTPAFTALAGDAGAAVAYPDVVALADAVATTLEQPSPNRLDALLDRITDTLVGNTR